MTNIYTLVNPLFSATEALLIKIQRICTAQEIPFFIAGAMAREILLHHVHGRSMGRRTRDIDIAVFVDSWPMFDALKNTFIADGAKTVRDNVHQKKSCSNASEAEERFVDPEPHHLKRKD